MRDARWQPLVARTIPHAVALLGVAMAWGVEREGVTCAEAWGWFGLAIAQAAALQAVYFRTNAHLSLTWSIGALFYSCA